MERLLYELKPYYCMVLGLWAVFMPAVAGRICGLSLTAIGIHLFVQRWKYRSARLANRR